MKDWTYSVERLRACLSELSITSLGEKIDTEAGFSYLTRLTLAAREAGNTIYLIGNGASASMASHVAADLAKNARLHTQVFTDLSLITAVANDLSYDEVFAEPLRRRMSKRDVLVAISSSGSSPNILRASREAVRLGGEVVTLSAMRADNPLRSVGVLNFHVAADGYGLAETCHAAILHFWIDQVVEMRGF